MLHAALGYGRGTNSVPAWDPNRDSLRLVDLARQATGVDRPVDYFGRAGWKGFVAPTGVTLSNRTSLLIQFATVALRRMQQLSLNCRTVAQIIEAVSCPELAK